MTTICSLFRPDLRRGVDERCSLRPRKVLALTSLLSLALGLAPLPAQVAPYAAPRLGLLKKTSALLGEPVVDEREKKLGQVRDLVVDLDSGGVPLALVAVGAQLVPVPTDLCSDASINRLVLKLKKASFSYAPQVEPANATAGRSLEHAWKYFHGTAPSAAASVPPRQLCAARLLGLPLRSAAHEPLGSVNDLMVDLPTGRLVYLVIAPGQPAAPGDLYAVPPGAVQWDEQSSALTLKSDRTHFLAGPHFQKDFWSDITFPAFAGAVREHYPAGTVHADAGATQTAQAAPGL